jgi:hypothetical protein
MDNLRTDLDVASISNADAKRRVRGVLVNANSPFSWLPQDELEVCGIEPLKQVRFRLDDRTLLDRLTGIAFIHVGDRMTVDEVVFAESGDPIVLGARTLSGLGLRIDTVLKELVDAGPAPAAAAA